MLTIDDGYADNGEIAAPILERLGFGATIFTVTGCLGAVNDWSDAAPLRGRRLLSVQQLASLHEHGIEFGAPHTSCLPDLPDEAVVEEVESSREGSSGPGHSDLHVRCPYGRLDDRAIAAVQRTGFLSACTTDRASRTGDHPLLIPRIEIKQGTPSGAFCAKCGSGSVTAQPLVSVVMCAWKPRPDWLTTRSQVLADESDLELIVVDDGSGAG